MHPRKQYHAHDLHPPDRDPTLVAHSSARHMCEPPSRHSRARRPSQAHRCSCGHGGVARCVGGAGPILEYIEYIAAAVMARLRWIHALCPALYPAIGVSLELEGSRVT